jgi:hypothetical protein
MNRSLMLSDSERSQLAALFAFRDGAVAALRKALERDPDYAANPSAWTEETDEQALKVLAANAKILAFNDSKLVGKCVSNDEDGIPGAKRIFVIGGWIDPDDRDELPRWNFDGEEFLSSDPTYYREHSSPVELLASEDEEDYVDYIAALRYAAKHGWPPLTKRHRKNLGKLLEDLQAATHYIQDILAHG